MHNDLSINSNKKNYLITFDKMQNCEDCGYQEDGRFDVTYSCIYCHGRKTCEICGDLLNFKGFMSNCCYPVERRCIKRCENCIPQVEDWWCNDCLSYRVWSLDECAGSGADEEPDDLVNRLKISQQDTFKKIFNLKKYIQKGKVFEVEGKLRSHWPICERFR